MSAYANKSLKVGKIKFNCYSFTNLVKNSSMKGFITLTMVCIFVCTAQAQYTFTHTKDIGCTEVKNQARTGTCWSFATASFLESELMRRGFDGLNLSEMYVVRNIYNDKARNYVLRQGKANFSQGSLSHDLIAAVTRNGIVPESVYDGMQDGEKSHDHSEMEAGMKGFLDGVIKSKRVSKKWDEALNGIMDAYMGEVPSSFSYGGLSYTAESFAKYLGLDAGDYVSLTSFSHHPYNASFILEIPDNYSNGSYYNIPLDQLMQTIDQAVDAGFSVAWDGDVSEKSFNAREGIAVLPVDGKREDLFKMPGEELKVTQEMRQEAFESYATTDDHLMHIVGKATDQNGNKYYIIKNSWGEISPYKGYLYMSEAYVAMKTVAIMLHKDALSDELREAVSE